MPRIPDSVRTSRPWKTWLGRLVTFARLQRPSGGPRSASGAGHKFRLALEARSNRISILIAALTACCCVIWVLASRYIVPGVIRSAYYGTSWAFLNQMITNQASEPLRHYLVLWNALAANMLLIIAVCGALLLLAARPELRDAFWGPEPAPNKEEAEGWSAAEPVKLPWRQRLVELAGSWEMALLFGGALLIGLVLRMVCLGTNSFHEDEIFSVMLARIRLPGFLWILAHGEANMALYYGLLRWWIHLGQSELVVRSLSVIFTLATLPLLFAMGSRMFGRKVGMIGVLLFVINGFDLEYSRNARSYSLLIFLVTLSSWSFLQSISRGSRRDWTRYMATNALAIYAHVFAVLVLAAHWIFLLLIRRNTAPWRRMLPSTVAIGLLALPLAILARSRDNASLSWIARTSCHGVYECFVCLAGKPDYLSVPGYVMALLLSAYAIPLAVAVSAFTLKWPWKIARDEARHLAFLLAWLVVPMLLTLAISVRQPMFIARYLIICLPPLVLLVAHGLSRLRHSWGVVGWICVIAGLTAPGIAGQYKFPPGGWKGAAEYVFSNERPGDAVVYFPTYYESRLEYYLDEHAHLASGKSLPGTFLFVPPHEGPEGPILANLPVQHNRVWFIGKVLPEQGKDTLELAKERQIEATLATEFPGCKKERDFPGQLAVILYQR